MKRGASLVNQTVGSLFAAMDAVSNGSSRAGEIAAQSKQQAEAVAQITLGAAVVQTNSATAEQSAAASEELSGHAQTLKALLSRFKVKQEALQLTRE